MGSIPGSGKSPGGGNGYLLQYSRLENPMDRGAWWSTVHGVAKSWTWVSDWAHPGWLYTLFFFLIFKLYNIVFVLPNIEMNPPQVYMCSPSWTLLPPPSHYHPSGSSQCTSPKHQVSFIEPGLVTRFIHDIYMFQCHSPKSSHPLPLP